jgi:O-antigen/teichoic acid export membrane protein
MLRLLPLKSDFSRNVATLFTGTLIAQILPILVLPLLTRLYTPEDFGVLGFFMAVLGLFSVIANGRLQLAIVLPSGQKDAVNVMVLALLAALFTGILSFLLIIFFRENISVLLLNQSAQGHKALGWLYWIPLSVVLVGLSQALNYWSSRNKTFKINALSRIFQSGGNVLVAAGIGFTIAGPYGLIAGIIAGQLLSSIILLISLLRESDFNEIKNFISKKSLKENLMKYKSFPLVNTPHALVGSLQENGVVFFITWFFSSTILGFYSFAYRILYAPLGIIGSSMYQVFYQKASVVYNEGGDISGLVVKMYKKLAIFGFPIFFVLFWVSPSLFHYVFGAHWTESGEIARILVPYLFLNYIAGPVSCLPLIVNKQREAFIISIIDIIFRFSAIVIGGILGNYKLGFILLSTWGTGLMLFAIWWYYRISKTRQGVLQNR